MKKIFFLFAFFMGLYLTGISQKGRRELPGNSQNPFDNIGKMHNDGLDFIAGLNISADEFIANWQDYVRQFAKSKGIDDDEFKKAYDENIDNMMGRRFLITDYNPNGDLDFYLEKGYITDKAFAYLKRMYLLIDGIDDKIFESSCDLNMVYRILKKGLVELESEVMGSNLMQKEKNMIFQACAIARYSVHYSMEQSEKLDNFWAIPKCGGGYFFKFSWKRAGGCDAAGAVVGAVRSGVAALAGPVGLGVVGTAAGLGAIGSSGAYLIRWAFCS